MPSIKPFKVIQELIEAGGATAESLIEKTSLENEKQLSEQLNILQYFDKYAITNDKGVYSLVDEDEYKAWLTEQENKKHKQATKDKFIKDLKNLIKKDPDKMLRESNVKLVKTFETYSKIKQRSEDNKNGNDRLVMLKLQLQGIKFQIAQEEDNRLKEKITSVLNEEGEEFTLDNVPSVNAFILDKLAKLSI